MNVTAIKKNIGLISLWIVFILSFVFVYSEAFHNTKFDYTREVVLAFMAASVTILITALLLRQQTHSEELKESHAEIFRKKFEVYEEFFKNILLLYENGSDKENNIRQIEISFYKLLLFMKSPSSFQQLYNNVMHSIQESDRAQISQLLNILREELGIHEENKSWRNEQFCQELDAKMGNFIKVAKIYCQSSSDSK